MEFILIIVAVALAGFFVYIWFNKQKKEDSQKEDHTVKEEGTPKWIDNLNESVSLNQTLREDSSLSKEILNTFESLLDKLMIVVPKMNETYPLSDMTYVVNKISTSYTTDLFRPYLLLDSDSREGENTITLVHILEGLNTELDKISDTIENRQEKDLENEVEFLKRKFLDDKVDTV